MTLSIDSSFSVPRETLEKLRLYEALLVKWQKAINLVGPASLADAWDRHFVDSLQIAPLVPESAQTLYDLGSGAGFPGLVLAIARPGLSVTLIEADQKKCAFLGTVSHETKAPIKIHSERIEKTTETLPAPDIITARALAGLVDLFAYILPWAKANPDLLSLFPKGASWREEIALAEQSYDFTYEAIPSKTEPAAVILLVRALKEKTGAQ
jgi:16S rRNA (guanine527-N7)-methyltransferase